MSPVPTETRRAPAEVGATRPETALTPPRPARPPDPTQARRLPRWVAAVPPLMLVIVAAIRWSNGWLLLLDSSPGPRSAPWSGPDLPVGIGLRSVVGLVTAIDPSLVGWIVPTGAVVAAYAGGFHLVRQWRGPQGERLGEAAAIVGGCIAAANPFVAARLYSGQIGVLWGYAALWWLVAALLRGLDTDDRRSRLGPGLWLAAAAAATVHMVVIGAVPILVAGVVAARRHGRRTAMTQTARSIAIGLGTTAVWLVPLLIRRSGSIGEAGGERAAHAFASGGPESTLWLRAAGGAAFWRPLPAGSLTFFGVFAALGWLGTAAAWNHGRGHSRDLRRLLLATALVGVVAVYAGHGVLAAAWSWSVTHLWPAGLLREPGKLAMLAVLVPACGAAVAVHRFLSEHRRAGPAIVAVVVVAFVAVWADFSQRLVPSDYPAEWVDARSAADSDSCPIAVLGDGAYTNPGFTDGRVVAHPARGFLGPRSIVSNDAQMPGLRPRPAVTASERWSGSTNARYLDLSGETAGPAPDAGDAAEAGIGWVFVDRPADRPLLVAELDAGGFEAAYASDRAGMWRVPGGCA